MDIIIFCDDVKKYIIYINIAIKTYKDENEKYIRINTMLVKAYNREDVVMPKMST